MTTQIKSSAPFALLRQAGLFVFSRKAFFVGLRDTPANPTYALKVDGNQFLSGLPGSFLGRNRMFRLL
jgi:hypothetical protein